MKLVLAEKPSVAQSIAKVLGADRREDGYIEGNGYIVSWCIGHLVELAQPEDYDEKYSKNYKYPNGVLSSIFDPGRKKHGNRGEVSPGCTCFCCICW